MTLVKKTKPSQIPNLAPTRLASPSIFNVPMTFVFIVCQNWEVSKIQTILIRSQVQLLWVSDSEYKISMLTDVLTKSS